MVELVLRDGRVRVAASESISTYRPVASLCSSRRGTGSLMTDTQPSKQGNCVPLTRTLNRSADLSDCSLGTSMDDSVAADTPDASDCWVWCSIGCGTVGDQVVLGVENGGSSTCG